MITALLIWTIIVVAAGILAANKNRSVIGWVILTGLFIPIIIILLVLSKKPETQNLSNSGTKKCPHCAEDIKVEAILCRFCNKEFPSQPEFKP